MQVGFWHLSLRMKYSSVTIQIKDIEQYFTMILFIIIMVLFSIYR